MGIVGGVDNMNKKALLEAALFVTDKPLTLEHLAAIVGAPYEEIERMVNELKHQLRNEERGIELIETPEGAELRVKQPYREQVAKLAPFSDLSDGMLRTLAIIAVKHPVKQSSIVKYQGNKVYGYVKDLEDKGLIRTEKFRRTKIITPTDDFEKYFGKSSAELKQLLNDKLKEKPKEKEQS